MISYEAKVILFFDNQHTIPKKTKKMHFFRQISVILHSKFKKIA